MKRSKSSASMYSPGTMEVPAQIKYRSKIIEVKRGITVKKLMELHPHEDDNKIPAVLLNNRIVSLSSPIMRSGTICPVYLDSFHGSRIYRRHLTMMLYEVFYSLYPDCDLRIGQSISEGVYFEISDVKVDDAFVQSIKKNMDKLAQSAKPFQFDKVLVDEARRLFHHKKTPSKRLLLDGWSAAYVNIMSIDKFVDFCLGPVAPHTGYFKKFKLFELDGDLVLQFPDLGKDSDVPRNKRPQPKLYKTHKIAHCEGKKLGITHVGDLNAACINGSIKQVIQIAEGMHEKKISRIADEILRNRKIKLVLIAGPSSAGKTTFTKRLSIQLKVVGLYPYSISLDNYYVDRKKTPLNKDGNPDFEALEAVDLALLSEHLEKILKYQKVRIPKYNFTAGHRVKKDKWDTIEFKKNQVLLIEGIHGLNDALTSNVPSLQKYKIYINALNPLAIDNHNRLNTSDTRLLRRIVRDRHYRGYMASQTIESWPLVRLGERKHIFLFQESADMIFDTSLIYEFSVLKIFADRYLMEVKRSDKAYAEAYRLRKFLELFVPVLPGDIPQTSLLREFIGGSGFSY